MITALLAIDVGGSNSRAIVVDMDGNCLGQGRNRGGNPGSNPPEQAAAAIAAAAEAAVAGAGGQLDLKVALLAMAGPRNPDVQRRLDAAFRALGLTGPVVFTGDTHAMLPSISAATEGYCVFAGTGSGAVRVRGGEIEAVVDAAGYLLGDLGSGYWLGHHAAIAVTAALEGRGPATALTNAVLGQLNIEVVRDRAGDSRPTALRHFIDAIYKMRPIELASFAPQVLACREDAVAADLLSRAVDYLMADFRLVLDPMMPGPVVLGGSVAAHLPGLREGLGAVLQTAGHAVDIRLSGDTSIGAAVLALRHEGIVVDKPMLARITASAASLATKASR